MCGLKTGQRRDVRGQRRDVRERIYANVATFRATSRRSGQRHDVPATGTKQRRVVGYQRRDVLETAKINVATLKSHVVTFQRV